MTARGPLLRALAFAGALAGAAAAVSAYTWFTGSGGAPVIWTTHYTTLWASPTTLTPTSTFGSALRTSATTWSTTTGSDFRFFVNNTFNDPFYGDLDGANDCYFSYLGYSTLGVTYVYYDTAGVAMWDCDVAFNNYPYYLWYPGYYDFHHVALHELGHVLGLGHSLDPAAVMVGFVGSGPQTHSIQQDDIAGEVFLYPKGGGGGGGAEAGGAAAGEAGVRPPSRRARGP